FDDSPQEDSQEDSQEDFQEESSLSCFRKRSHDDRNNPSNATFKPAPKKKNRSKYKRNNVCQVVVKVKRKEQKCGMEYTHDGSTSNMIAYLCSVHNIVDDSKLKAEIQQARQTKLHEIIKVNALHKNAKQSKNSKA
ncbi:20506_t:CDS:2, partial [Racocetra persica]